VGCPVAPEGNRRAISEIVSAVLRAELSTTGTSGPSRHNIVNLPKHLDRDLIDA
jgi:hypothetical protein